MRLISPSIGFFLLPFFLMAGVALQSAGLYFCLVILPLFFSQPMPRGARRVVVSSSTLLLICYFVPVITQSVLAVFENPLRYCVVDPPRIKSCALTLSAWLKSPVSSAFIGLAIGWIILSSRRSENSQMLVTPSTHAVNNDDALRTRFFSQGLFYATIVYFAYGFYQHLTGYNLLSADHILADEHRMANGRYRIFAFYGHPLSLAGASLVWFSVSSVALLKTYEEKAKVFGFGLIAWLTMTLLHSANVLMSGGRTALLVVMIIWASLIARSGWVTLKRTVLARWFANRHQTAQMFLLGCFVFVGIAAASAVLHWVPELSSRGMGGGTMGQGPLGDRPLFWQTYLSMWRDSPLFGQGYFAVEHGLRTEYYVREGLAALRDKFNAHNIYLEVLGISGLIGLLAYLVVLVLNYLNLRILAGNSSERRCILNGLLLALIANLLHGLTQDTFFDSALTACYLGLMGLLIVPPFRSNVVNAR